MARVPTVRPAHTIMLLSAQSTPSISSAPPILMSRSRAARRAGRGSITRWGVSPFGSGRATATMPSRAPPDPARGLDAHPSRAEDGRPHRTHQTPYMTGRSHTLAFRAATARTFGHFGGGPNGMCSSSPGGLEDRAATSSRPSRCTSASVHLSTTGRARPGSTSRSRTRHTAG